jgi:class I fructose-bisphosphate aldolase
MSSNSESHTPDRVKEILSWYRAENLGVITNLRRLMMHGSLAGTGKMVIFLGMT